MKSTYKIILTTNLCPLYRDRCIGFRINMRISENFSYRGDYTKCEKIFSIFLKEM